MSDISIWGYSLPRASLVQAEVDYLIGLPQTLPTVEWVWAEMDRVWFHFNLDCRHALAGQTINDFYSHPVWLMNGIFTTLDPVSVSHRCAIARYLDKIEVKSIADYGGGFGELARAITKAIPDATVCIIEPYTSKIGQEQIRIESRIRFVSDLFSDSGYDAIIAQDVLEHVIDPIRLSFEIAAAVREGGQVIFANCFYPVIQCHLPSTFHLRHTFPWVMKALGLHFMGRIDGAAHAQVFERVGRLNFYRARHAEAISHLFGPVFNMAQAQLSRIKALVLHS